jgi:hypothetical protein
MVHSEITLKGLKVARFLSEETLAYEAQVYFKVKYCGRAQNDGHGGCTNIHAIDDASRATLAAAEAWAKALPMEVTDIKNEDGSFFTYQPDFDSLVDAVANQMDIDKTVQASFKRDLKKVVFIKDGKVYTARSLNGNTLTPEFMEVMQKKHPSAVILNRLPPDQAFSMYRQAVAK